MHAVDFRACTMGRFLTMTDAEDRIGELMEGDDDQRQVERVSGDCSTRG